MTDQQLVLMRREGASMNVPLAKVAEWQADGWVAVGPLPPTSATVETPQAHFVADPTPPKSPKGKGK